MKSFKEITHTCSNSTHAPRMVHRVKMKSTWEVAHERLLPPSQYLIVRQMHTHKDMTISFGTACEHPSPAIVAYSYTGVHLLFNQVPFYGSSSETPRGCVLGCFATAPVKNTACPSSSVSRHTCTPAFCISANFALFPKVELMEVCP